MRIKLFFGLWGCSSDGILTSPSRRFEFKLPSRVAFKIQSFLHSISYVGLINTIYIKDLLRFKHNH